MKLSGTKTALIALAGAVTLLWLADEYPWLTFHGDAHFSGGRVFGYWIKMRRIPFDRPGEYVFHFRGMPNEEMSLQLYAEGKSDDNREELTHIETTIEAILTDQRGQTVCSASGMPLKNGNNPNGWVLMSGGEAAYWHWNCAHIRVYRANSYTLILRILNVDPHSPKVTLVPTWEGGQLDLP